MMKTKTIPTRVSIQTFHRVNINMQYYIYHLARLMRLKNMDYGAEKSCCCDGTDYQPSGAKLQKILSRSRKSIWNRIFLVSSNRNLALLGARIAASDHSS